jgi:SAF domain-containing protein
VNAALVISERDNVATALEPLDKGRTITVGGATVLVAEPIARGHKIALHAIHAGDAVIKYGSPIGTASCDIAPGAHVHTHNVASARGRGDLAAGARESAASSAVPRKPDTTPPPLESQPSDSVASGFGRTPGAARPTAEPVE